MVGQEIYKLSTMSEQDSMTESHLCLFSVCLLFFVLIARELKRVNQELSLDFEACFWCHFRIRTSSSCSGSLMRIRRGSSVEGWLRPQEQCGHGCRCSGPFPISLVGIVYNWRKQSALSDCFSDWDGISWYFVSNNFFINVKKT